MEDAQCLGAIEQAFSMASSYEPVLPSARFNHVVVQAHFVLSLATLFGYKKYLEIGTCFIVLYHSVAAVGCLDGFIAYLCHLVGLLLQDAALMTHSAL
jgi:hypothetical protein